MTDKVPPWLAGIMEQSRGIMLQGQECQPVAFFVLPTGGLKILALGMLEDAKWFSAIQSYARQQKAVEVAVLGGAWAARVQAHDLGGIMAKNLRASKMSEKRHVTHLQYVSRAGVYRVFDCPYEFKGSRPVGVGAFAEVEVTDVQSNLKQLFEAEPDS